MEECSVSITGSRASTWRSSASSVMLAWCWPRWDFQVLSYSGLRTHANRCRMALGAQRSHVLGLMIDGRQTCSFPVICLGRAAGKLRWPNCLRSEVFQVRTDPVAM